MGGGGGGGGGGYSAYIERLCMCLRISVLICLTVNVSACIYECI